MKLTTDYSSQEVTISVILKAYLLSVNGAVGEEKILELNGKSYNLQFYPENGVRCFVWDCRAARTLSCAVQFPIPRLQVGARI